MKLCYVSSIFSGYRPCAWSEQLLENMQVGSFIQTTCIISILVKIDGVQLIYFILRNEVYGQSTTWTWLFTSFLKSISSNTYSQHTAYNDNTIAQSQYLVTYYHKYQHQLQFNHYFHLPDVHPKPCLHRFNHDIKRLLRH